MKKYIVISFMMYCFCMTIKSQEIGAKRFLAYLPKYEMTNSILRSPINTVLSFAKTYPFYILKKPYHLVVKMWRNGLISIEARAYTSTYLHTTLTWNDSSEIGYFYYKGLFVLLLSKNDDPSLFFENTGVSDSIFYQDDDNIQEHADAYSFAPEVFFECKGNKIVMSDFSENNDNEFTARYYNIWHIVKVTDTEEGIAKEYNLPIKVFRFDTHPLVPGTLIKIHFNTNDGTMNHYDRRFP